MSATPILEPSTAQLKRQKQLTSTTKFRLFSLMNLPSIAFWNVKLKELSLAGCTVTIPYSKRTTNPFKSTYFAAQAGAGELSTGALVMLHLAGLPKTSMLVTEFRSKFYKKASDTLTITCSDGAQLGEVIQATEDGQGHSITLTSKAYLPDGTLASEFWVTWSFKRKRER